MTRAGTGRVHHHLGYVVQVEETHSCFDESFMHLLSCDQREPVCACSMPPNINFHLSTIS